MKPMPAAQSRFNRQHLPQPADYFKNQGVAFKGGGEWKDAICPFHNDTKPSLRLRLDTGAFRCMVCGAHGGDVLAFHRLKTGLGFIDAAKALGAWGAGL
ncbi:MAG: CHC2 zinc finger domain-containing protein [Pseudomonadales bacterium]|jgi:DNA primase